MFRRNRDLWYSLVAILAVTVVYLVPSSRSGGLPAASTATGHAIGIAGMALMLVTETAYSIRKQATDARWGSIAGWLRFHMVTGLVGPYMVLLHTAMRFRGLAGVATLLTFVVVVSGLVGRYVYTAVPIPAEGPGADTASAEVLRWRRSTSGREALASWRAFHVPLTWVLFAFAFVHAAAELYYGLLQR